MTERPVEELIGWSSVPNAENMTGPTWATPDGGLRRRAEVDDLAAWLNERDPGWRLERDDRCTGWGVSGWNRVPRFRKYHTVNDVGWTPAIRDALVAAVRKVSEHDEVTR